MNFYQHRNRWKILLFLFAVSIIFFTLWYTHRLAESIASEEINKASEIADAYKILNSNTSDELELSKALDKIKLNHTIPVIWANAQNDILAEKNFDSLKVKKDSKYLEKELQKLKTKGQFINIQLSENEKQYLYYKDSDLLVSIRKYPFYVLALVALFFVISYAAFTSARRAEQNQVWVGLAKETAHQLGTPLSSLTAWIDILREKLDTEEDSMMFDEMQKDIDRLVLIADRFSVQFAEMEYDAEATDGIGMRLTNAYKDDRTFEQKLQWSSYKFTQSLPKWLQNEIAATNEGGDYAEKNSKLVKHGPGVAMNIVGLASGATEANLLWQSAKTLGWSKAKNLFLKNSVGDIIIQTTANKATNPQESLLDAVKNVNLLESVIAGFGFKPFTNGLISGANNVSLNGTQSAMLGNMSNGKAFGTAGIGIGMGHIGNFTTGLMGSKELVGNKFMPVIFTGWFGVIEEGAENVLPPQK